MKTVQRFHWNVPTSTKLVNFGFNKQPKSTTVILFAYSDLFCFTCLRQTNVFYVYAYTSDLSCIGIHFFHLDINGSYNYHSTFSVKE